MKEPIATTYEFNGFRVDPVRRLLFGFDGKPLFLKPKVFDTLLYLVEHPGEICGKRALMEAIWPGLVVEENNLNQNVSTLRRVLGEHRGEHRFIVTETGRGYRFVAPVTTMTGASTAAVGEPAAADSAEATGQPTPRLRKRLVPIAAAGALLGALLLAALLWRWGQDVPLPNSVAVLPFENLSTNPDDAYVAAGLHGEILNRLSKIAALNVINQGSMLRYANSSQSIREIARELNVLTVLTTSVAYSDENVQINSQLTEAATGRLLWADRQGGHIDEIFGIEAQIAANVAAALRAQFSVAERAALDTPPTRSSLAYDRYLRAQDPGISFEQALRYLDEATRNDESFALAYALKAQLYAGQFRSQANREAADPEGWSELETLARAAAEKALELDGDSWLAHVALGDLEQSHWRWTNAIREYELAARTIPRNVWHPHVTPWLRNLDFESAIRDQREVVALDPRSGQAHWILGLYHSYSHDTTRALAEFREAQKLEPGDLAFGMSVVHAEGILGNRRAALEQMRQLETLDAAHASAVSIVNLAYAYARNGSAADATRLVGILADQAPDRVHQAGNWALAYLAVGDRAAALGALDTVIAKIENETPDPGDIALRMIRVNLYADPMLDEPEFVARREKLRGH